MRDNDLKNSLALEENLVISQKIKNSRWQTIHC